jgi:hypothetical protein
VGRPEAACDRGDRDGEGAECRHLGEGREPVAAREQHRREHADLRPGRVAVEARVARVRHVRDGVLLLPERGPRQVVCERVPLERRREEREAEYVERADADDGGERHEERVVELRPKGRERRPERGRPGTPAAGPHERDDGGRRDQSDDEPPAGDLAGGRKHEDDQDELGPSDHVGAEEELRRPPRSESGRAEGAGRHEEGDAHREQHDSESSAQSAARYWA